MTPLIKFIKIISLSSLKQANRKKDCRDPEQPSI